MSPWASKRLHEFGGDISKFKVIKIYPSILDQIGVSKTEPGDENNPQSFKVRKAKVGGYRDYFTDEEATEIDTLVNTTLEPGYGYTNKPAADAGTAGQAPDPSPQS